MGDWNWMLQCCLTCVFSAAACQHCCWRFLHRWSWYLGRRCGCSHAGRWTYSAWYWCGSLLLGKLLLSCLGFWVSSVATMQRMHLIAGFVLHFGLSIELTELL